MLKTLLRPQIGESIANQTKAELWRSRWFLMVGLGLAVILAVIWGYVITPRTGPIFGIWCGLTVLATLLLVLAFARALQKAATLQRNTAQQTKASWTATLPLGLLLLLPAAFGFTLLLIFLNPQPLRFDAYYYNDEAYSFLKSGYIPNAVRPPGYTLFLAVVYKLMRGVEPNYDYVFGPPATFFADETSVWIAQALLLTLAVGLVYFAVCEAQVLGGAKPAHWVTGKFYWGQPLPLLAATLTTFCPFTAAFGAVLLTEVAALFWLTLSVFLWLKTLHYPRLWLYWVLLGVALVWLLETRPTFIYLPGAVLLTALVFGAGRWKILGPGLALAAMLLFFIPQSASNLQYTGSVNPVIAGDLAIYNQVEGIFWETNGGLRYQRLPSDVPLDAATADGLRHFADILPLLKDKQAEQQSQAAYWHNYFNAYLKAHPLQFAATAAKRLWYQWDQHYVYPFYDPAYFDYRWLTDNLNRLYLIFGLVGAVAISWRWRRGVWPFWLSLTYLMLVNAIVRTEFRYTLPAYPLLLALAAVGIWEVGSKVLHRKKPSEAEGKRGLFSKDGGIWSSLAVGALLVITLSITLPVIPPTTANREKAFNALDQASDYQKRASRNLPAAHNAFNLAVQLDPTEPEVFLERGMFLKDQPGNCDKVQARLDFEKYLQIAPANASPRVEVEKALPSLPQVASSGC